MADRQHGVVALDQIVSLGVSKRTAREWVATGRLQRLHREVFAVGHRALRIQGHWMAALLACGPGGVLSHRAAGALHDLCSPGDGPIDVTVPGRIGRSRPGIRVHSADRLPADEITVVEGLPCTTVERTIFDLASVRQGRSLERICERAHRRHIFDPFEIGVLLARHRGRRGAARLRAVIRAWVPGLERTNEELEVRFLRLLIEADLEPPVVNGLVEADGRTFEVDFHWPRQRVIIETDGATYHDNPLARNRDAERDRALAAAGWTTGRLGWSDVTQHPKRTVRLVRRLLDGPDGSA